MKLSVLWNHYWFRPFPLIYLALARILAVGFQILFLLGSHLGELRRMSQLPDAFYDPIPLLHLFLVPFGFHGRPSLEIVQLVYAVTLIAGAFALKGLLSHFSLMIFAAGNLFMQGYLYSFHDIHHGQTAMMMFLIFLALSPSGRLLSIDQWIRKLRSKPEKNKTEDFHFLKRRSRFALWPFLLMHWIFALIYLSAAKGKWSNNGFEWANGHTLQYYFFEYSVRKGVALGDFFGSQHVLAVVLSWFTLFFESTFWFILPIPGLILLYAPMGFLFHFGTAITLKAEFYSFMTLYIVFLPWLLGQPLAAGKKTE